MIVKDLNGVAGTITEVGRGTADIQLNNICPDDKLKSTLDSLNSLFPEKGVNIRALKNGAGYEIRIEFIPLADAFALPDWAEK